MEQTIEELSLRKAVLSYFCQETTSDNLELLKSSLENKDSDKSGFLTYEEF